MAESSNAPFGPPEPPHGGWPNPYSPGGYGAPAQPYPGVMPRPTGRGNGLGIASLAVGFVAVVAVVTIFGGAILGIAAVVMGVVARWRVKRGEATDGGVAVVGIVLGIVAIALSVFAIWLIFGTELFNESYQRCLDQRGGDCAEYR